MQPSSQPTGSPSSQPSSAPSGQPTCVPSAAPSYVREAWGQVVTDGFRRTRSKGMCENFCSGHGSCEKNRNCLCHTGADGEAEWTGPDCSLRTCPKDIAWVGRVVNANDLHPYVECSNKGLCDRGTGVCECFSGYEESSPYKSTQTAMNPPQTHHNHNKPHLNNTTITLKPI